MGAGHLIVELESTSFDDVTEEHAELSVDEQIANLLPHFYPPKDLSSPKFVSLIKYKDMDNEDLGQEYQWEESPQNWLHQPSVLDRLSTLFRQRNVLTRNQLGLLTPVVLQVLECPKRQYRKRGMDLVLQLFRVNDDVSYLLNARIHRIITDAILCSLTMDDVDLVRESYQTAVHLLDDHLQKESTEHWYVGDAILERSMTSIGLLHGRSSPVRLEHWIGLESVAIRLDRAFVRHFHWFFKTCESCSIDLIDEERVVVMRMFDHLATILPERFALRQDQVIRIREQLSLDDLER